jgi:drug/metabolite transporter (DMT)-like permease
MQAGGNTMSEGLLQGIREIGHYRNLIAIGLPVLGGALVVASATLMPRGKAKGLVSGAYMLLASLGAACLLFALFAGMEGEPRSVVVPLLVPGIVLTVVMGIFSPAVIREYQQFEFRKLAAEIFRRS